ncbi:MAG: hypothetical protein QOF01_5326 [Thermomicrobiales bacterium]|jgi:hypothetical protein|nr:hypothetical protein [Thermomicrobiales bacterium]
MAKDVERTNGTVVDPPLEYTFDEANARFFGEWVLFQILEFDEHWEPIRGLVWAHSPKRGDLSPVLAARPKRTKDDPYQPYYPFYAMPRSHSGETAEETLARFRQQRAMVLAGVGSESR